MKRLHLPEDQAWLGLPLREKAASFVSFSDLVSRSFCYQDGHPTAQERYRMSVLPAKSPVWLPRSLISAAALLLSIRSQLLCFICQ
jgi:hypothetical protein